MSELKEDFDKAKEIGTSVVGYFNKLSMDLPGTIKITLTMSLVDCLLKGVMLSLDNAYQKREDSHIAKLTFLQTLLFNKDWVNAKLLHSLKDLLKEKLESKNEQI